MSGIVLPIKGLSAIGQLQELFFCTEKPCGQCKHRWMECCLKDKRERLTVDAADEACESFELHLGKLDEAFVTSLEKARRKHPKFIDLGQKYSDYSIAYFQEKAESLKVALEKSDCPLRTLLNAEVYAFLFEIARGNFDRALEEAGDIMAVLYRALNGEGKEVRNESHAD